LIGLAFANHPQHSLVHRRQLDPGAIDAPKRACSRYASRYYALVFGDTREAIMSRILLVVVLACIASVIATIGLTDAALAQKRVALVIGNGAYTKVPPLDNPKNDAAAMAAMFKAVGFDAVARVNDLGVASMRRALRDFSDTAQNADVAVVFYAGHGIEVGGVNYLIPTDAVLERDIDAPDEAISLDRINQVLEPVRRLRLIILDACRDNPFARSMRRTIATRSVRSGYGEIDERSLPPNTLVAYAQRAGFTAWGLLSPRSMFGISDGATPVESLTWRCCRALGQACMAVRPADRRGAAPKISSKRGDMRGANDSSATR
jgi:uncharacterized caspase-like protein